MGQRLDAFLVLGCNGSKISKNFTLCKGVSNPIIDLSSLSESNYLEIIDFFDNACNLFDTTMNDYNKCINTIAYLHRKHEAFSKDTINNIQSFTKMHKDCGIWIMLILKEDFKNE